MLLCMKLAISQSTFMSLSQGQDGTVALIICPLQGKHLQTSMVGLWFLGFNMVCVLYHKDT